MLMAEEVTEPVRIGALPKSDDGWAALLRFYRGRCDVSFGTFDALIKDALAVALEKGEWLKPFPIGVDGKPYTPITALYVHVRHDVEDGVLHPCTCPPGRWDHLPKQGTGNAD
jgi:hypothetical protein